jgi:hypothetical protein
MAIQIKEPSAEHHPDLSFEDVLSFIVPDKLRAIDKELFAIKWWDYRFMSPCAATFAYIDIFGVEARKLYARDIDYERAAHIRVVTAASVMDGLRRNDEKAKRSFSGFWRGRQVADALSVPYDIYISEALSSRMRAWQRTHMPTALQVYRDIDVERVANRWEELKASRVYYATHHAYLAQNYQGAPYQDEYFRHLIERARQTTDFVATLADMVDADHMPVEFLRRHVDQGICDRVLASQR